MNAVEYHAYKPQLRETVGRAYQALSSQYDCVVIEGAGSPAEINLKDGDLVNMGMAKQADATGAAHRRCRAGRGICCAVRHADAA